MGGWLFTCFLGLFAASTYTPCKVIAVAYLQHG